MWSISFLSINVRLDPLDPEGVGKDDGFLKKQKGNSNEHWNMEVS